VNATVDLQGMMFEAQKYIEKL